MEHTLEQMLVVWLSAISATLLLLCTAINIHDGRLIPAAIHVLFGMLWASLAYFAYRESSPAPKN